MNKITIACLYCRQRRIRCDGDNPCGSCTERGKSCEYPTVSVKLKPLRAGGPAAASTKRGLEPPPRLTQLLFNGLLALQEAPKKRGPKPRHAEPPAEEERPSAKSSARGGRGGGVPPRAVRKSSGGSVSMGDALATLQSMRGAPSEDHSYGGLPPSGAQRLVSTASSTASSVAESAYGDAAAPQYSSAASSSRPRRSRKRRVDEAYEMEDAPSSSSSSRVPMMQEPQFLLSSSSSSDPLHLLRRGSSSGAYLYDESASMRAVSVSADADGSRASHQGLVPLFPLPPGGGGGHWSSAGAASSSSGGVGGVVGAPAALTRLATVGMELTSGSEGAAGGVTRASSMRASFTGIQSDPRHASAVGAWQQSVEVGRPLSRANEVVPLTAWQQQQHLYQQQQQQQQQQMYHQQQQYFNRQEQQQQPSYHANRVGSSSISANPASTSSAATAYVNTSVYPQSSAPMYLPSSSSANGGSGGGLHGSAIAATASNASAAAAPALLFAPASPSREGRGRGGGDTGTPAIASGNTPSSPTQSRYRPPLLSSPTSTLFTTTLGGEGVATSTLFQNTGGVTLSLGYIDGDPGGGGGSISGGPYSSTTGGHPPASASSSLSAAALTNGRGSGSRDGGEGAAAAAALSRARGPELSPPASIGMGINTARGFDDVRAAASVAEGMGSSVPHSYSFFVSSSMSSPPAIAAAAVHDRHSQVEVGQRGRAPVSSPTSSTAAAAVAAAAAGAASAGGGRAAAAASFFSSSGSSSINPAFITNPGRGASAAELTGHPSSAASASRSEVEVAAGAAPAHVGAEHHLQLQLPPPPPRSTAFNFNAFVPLQREDSNVYPLPNSSSAVSSSPYVNPAVSSNNTRLPVNTGRLPANTRLPRLRSEHEEAVAATLLMMPSSPTSNSSTTAAPASQPSSAPFSGQRSSSAASFTAAAAGGSTASMQQQQQVTSPAQQQQQQQQQTRLYSAVLAPSAMPLSLPSASQSRQLQHGMPLPSTSLLRETSMGMPISDDDAAAADPSPRQLVEPPQGSRQLQLPPPPAAALSLIRGESNGFDVIPPATSAPLQLPSGQLSREASAVSTSTLGGGLSTSTSEVLLSREVSAVSTTSGLETSPSTQGLAGTKRPRVDTEPTPADGSM